jgi:abequosyltransferase
MTAATPLITVCVPAFNRANVLGDLLDSVMTQQGGNFDVLICEDGSPERDLIRKIVAAYQHRYPGQLEYQENAQNLGYDGNLRNLIQRARGDYCFFMGNDDLMCPGAIETVSSVLSRYPEVGVVLRSYAAFDGTSDNVVQTFRYFDRELFFPAGAPTIATIYRRSVVIPGMVLHRQAALRWSTDRFDGTLLYQLYLVANILADMSAVFVPTVTVLYRNGGVPDFGNSETERGRFVPKSQTADSSLHFMQGMLEIARTVDAERKLDIYRPILRDIANYSYPVIAIQAGKSRAEFLRYCLGLARLGLARYPMFHVYVALVLILGTKLLERIIVSVKLRLGRTPTLGKVYRGESR